LSGTRPRPTIVVIAQRTDNLTVCDRVVRLEMGASRTIASVVLCRRAATPPTPVVREFPATPHEF